MIIRKSRGRWKDIINNYNVYCDSVKYNLMRYLHKVSGIHKKKAKRIKKKEVRKFSINSCCTIRYN